MIFSFLTLFSLLQSTPAPRATNADMLPFRLEARLVKTKWGQGEALVLQTRLIKTRKTDPEIMFAPPLVFKPRLVGTSAKEASPVPDRDSESGTILTDKNGVRRTIRQGDVSLSPLRFGSAETPLWADFVIQNYSLDRPGKVKIFLSVKVHYYDHQPHPEGLATSEISLEHPLEIEVLPFSRRRLQQIAAGLVERITTSHGQDKVAVQTLFSMSEETAFPYWKQIVEGREHQFSSVEVELIRLETPMAQQLLETIRWRKKQAYWEESQRLREGSGQNP